jgi:hypothetical protein
MEKENRRLVKKYHVLCGRLGLTEEDRRAMLTANYGAVSSLDLTEAELMELCDALDRQLRPEAGEMDRWRKRLLGAIFGYFKAIGRATDMAEVKRVACRAAEATEFNRIPIERLRSLYSAFRKRHKDVETVAAITGETLLSRVSLN